MDNNYRLVVTLDLIGVHMIGVQSTVWSCGFYNSYVFSVFNDC